MVAGVGAHTLRPSVTWPGQTAPEEAEIVS